MTVLGPPGPDTVAGAVERATFRNTSAYPFCPGCGHGSILDRLDEAFGRLGLDRRRVALVSDIGCSGLSDQYFDTHAFHGLHGRALTYAAGIKLARPELTVVVVMGDGGTGIGGAHLLAAARRNLDLTLLVFDNFNFGMTGGQHSPTTPAGAITATTPAGHLERPLDLCATAAAAGAAFVWRGTSFDADLGARIADGIRHPGFALLDVWEPCTAYFAPRNRLTRKAIGERMAELGCAAGMIACSTPPEFGAAYRAAAGPGGEPLAPEPLAPRFASRLEQPFRLVLAGAAGERIGTAARTLARAAVLSGLHAALRSDYPVTVRTGYSVAELVLAPAPIDDAGVPRPDALVVLGTEGLRQSTRRLAAMTPAGRVFALPGVAGFATAAAVERLDPAQAPRRLARDAVALAAAVAAARRLDLVSAAALAAAAGPGDADTVAAGLALAGET